MYKKIFIFMCLLIVGSVSFAVDQNPTGKNK